MRVYEQVDRSGGGWVYSWMADVSFKAGKTLLPGWRWVRGKPGCYLTTNEAEVRRLLGAIGKLAESNGSHDTHKAPGRLCELLAVAGDRMDTRPRELLAV